MDATDAKILRALHADARLTHQELSERVGLSPTPCARRVRRLEAAGGITGYTARIDEGRMGFGFSVFISIRLDQQTDGRLQAFEAAVQTFAEVVDCWLMTGRSDYLLRVIAADLDDYEQFVRRELQRVPGIASIDTSFAYGSVKHAQVLPEV